MWRRILSLILAELLILGQIAYFGPVPNLYAANEAFEQTDWSGGETSATAQHPDNKTGWVRYKSRVDPTGQPTDKINTSVAGKTFLDTEMFSVVDTSDTDFSKGARENLVISGTGEAAALQLEPGLADPFTQQLSRWINLNEMPALDAFSAFAKAGDYIYALWERDVFGRYSIVNENWEFLANLPDSIGPGAALAYPGSGNYIYAVQGGTSKNFFRYHIPVEGDPDYPDGSWTKMADVSVGGVDYRIEEGGCLAATSTKVFCAPGRTSKFLEYDIATNVWVARTDIINGWTTYRQAQIVYPGTGNYLYLTRGGDSGSFAAYHITKQIWTDFTVAQGPAGLADLCYPGTGDYLYAWHRDTDRRFSRYKFQGAGSNVWESLPQVPTYAWRGFLYYPGSGTELKLLAASRRAGAHLKFDTSTLKWNVPLHGTNVYGYYGTAMAYDGSNWIYQTDGAHNTGFCRYSISGDIWQTMASAPIAIYYNADIAYLNNYVYATRGCGTTEFARYDTVSNTWTNLSSTAPTPAAVSWGGGGALVAAGNAIYAFRGASTTDFWKYDPGTNAWTNLTNPAVGPVIYFNGTGSALNDLTPGGTYTDPAAIMRYRVYIDGTGTPNTFRWSDDNGATWKATAVPITGSAQELNNGVTITFGATTGHTNANYWNFNAFTMAPDTVYNGSTLCYPGSGDFIYATRGNSTREFWRYSISANTWTIEANSYVPIFLSAKAKMKYPGAGDYLYLFPNNYNYFLRYKFQGAGAGTWEMLKNIPYWNISDFICMEAVGNKVYVNPRYNYQYERLVYDIPSGNWLEPTCDWSGSRPGYGSIIYTGQDTAYVFAGLNSKHIWKYSLSKDKWLGTINAPFYFGYWGTKATYPGTGNLIYVTEGNLTPRLWAYNFVTNTWSQLTDSPWAFNVGAQLGSGVDETGAVVIYALPGIDPFYTASSIQASWGFLKYTVSDPATGAGAWDNTLEQLPSNAYVRNYYQYGNLLIYIPSQKRVYYKVGMDSGLFYYFDTDRLTWLSLASTTGSLNGCIYYPGSGDFIYYFSGRSYFQKYSLTNNTWEDLARPPFGSGYTPSDSFMFYPGSGDFLYLTDHNNRFFGRYSLSNNDWDIPVTLPSAYCTYGYYGVFSEGSDGNTLYSGGYIYFYKYDISTRTWTALTSPYYSAPGSYWDEWEPQLIYQQRGDYLYATRGRNRNNFWRYSIWDNAWGVLATPPGGVNFGSGHKLISTPARIYALRGDSTKDFWTYDPGTNTWSAVAITPDTVNYGSSLCYPGEGNYIYATRGNRSAAFWRYSLSANTWESLAAVPVLLGGGTAGTSLVYPGAGDYLYLSQGSTYDYWGATSKIFRYSLSCNVWEEASALSPKKFLGSAKLVYPGAGDYLYASSGHGRYDLMKFLLFKRGTYTSDAKIIGRNQGYDILTWNSNSSDSVFEFKARTAENYAMAGASAWANVPQRRKGDDLTASYPHVRDKHKYIQYQMKFFADDMAILPELADLTLKYNKYPPALELISSAYNTAEANNRLMNLSWSRTQPSGSDIRFQLRTAPDNNGEPGTWTPFLGPGGTQAFNDKYDNPDEYAYAPSIEVVDGAAKLKKLYEGYLYTQRIILDNSAGTDSYTNTVFVIDIDSKNNDFWQHVKSDGSDVRFADGDGNALPYNLHAAGASFDYANKIAKIFVRVPSAPAGQKVNIYLKYGKSDAVSASDPDVVGIPYEGLMGYWPFDEGSGTIATDQSGNGNDGAFTGAPAWQDGQRGTALSFNGSFSVNFGNPATLQITGSQTYAMWLKPTNFTARRNPINKAYGGEGTMTIETNGTISYYYGTYGGNSSPYQGFSSTAISAGTWTHIALVRDLSAMKLRWYINGVKTAETNAAYSAAVASGNDLIVGSGYAGGFQGLIDEVAVYSRALDDDEVAGLSSGGGGVIIPYYFSSVETNTTSPSLSGWEYRNEIDIDNTQGPKLTNYQVKIELTKGNESFWQRCKNNGFDIRFVDSDNTAILNYYRANFDYVNQTATLWAKVPLIDQGQVKRIYLYYGRQDAADVSNFDSTFTKDFVERGYNTSGLNLDGIDDKVTVNSSNSLNITDNVTVEAQVKFGLDYWPQGWGYRKKVTLDNTQGPDYSSVIVQFDVAYQAEMNADYSDLRFWEADHSRKLKYRIYSSDETKATVYVEVSNVVAGSAKDIYIYYGNASATSESDATLGVMPVTGLVGYWNFDEGTGTTANNSAIPGDSGTISGATWVNGRYAKALSFNGTNSFVNCGNNAGLNIIDEVTMSAWVKTTAGSGIAISKDDSYYPEVRLGVSGSKVYSYIRTTVTSAGLSGAAVLINDDKWHHIVMTRKDGGYFKVYVDGNFENQATSPTGSLNSPSSPAVNIGRQYYAGSYAAYFNGIIDEPRIYNVVLSDAEIKQLYEGLRVLLSASFGSQQTEPATLKWFPGFGYRKMVTLDNTAGTQLNSVMLQFDVAYVAGKMKPDYADIRFVDTDGKKLRYRIKEYDPTKATVFVEIPLIPANSKKEIYVYYGNAGAVSEQSLIFGDYVPQSNLIGWWTFNEGAGATTADNSGNGNTGTLVNGALWTTGKHRYAIDFDNIDDGVNIANNNFAGLTDYTMAAWVNIKGNHRHSIGSIMSSGNWNSNYWVFGISQNNTQIHMPANSTGPSYTFQLNRWYHIAVTRSGSTGTFYIDGTNIGSVSLGTSALVSSDTNTMIGRETYAGGYFAFNGRIDNPVIYNRALTTTEIQVLYSGEGWPFTPAFSTEESQPSINIPVVAKSGAYELKFTQSGLSGLINGQIAASAVDYKYGELAHAAFTYDGANAKLYVNGVQKASQAFTGAINTNASPLVIGEGIKGIVDEARVWNRAQGVGLINEYKESCLAGNEAGLVAYLKFNENTGTAAADTTANGNNGTLQNGAGWIPEPFVYSNGQAHCLYHMDEGGGPDTQDASGNNNTLTLRGATWSATDLTGFSTGKSIAFDGFSAYADANDSDSLDATDRLSIEAWIKPTDNTQTDTILVKGDDTATRYNYRLIKSGNYVSFAFYNGAAYSFASTSAFISPNTTYQIVVTYDRVKGEVKIYQNSQQVYSGTCSVAMLANADKLLVGKEKSDSQVYSGLIDEVRIYKRALTAQEVLRHYEHRTNLINTPIEFNIYEPPQEEGVAAYAVNNPTIQPIFGVFYSNKNVAQFQEIATKPNNTNIKYQVSMDGYSWFWYNGSAWEPVQYGYVQANTATEINTNLSKYLDIYPSGDFYYRAFMHVDPGIFRTPLLDNVAITLKVGDTYYTVPTGAAFINPMHIDADGDQWVQYKALLYSDGEDTAILDDINFSYIKAYINVLTPNGEEELFVSQPDAQDPSGATHYNITWSSQAITGLTGFVKLQYSTDGGGNWTLIQDNVPNTGSFSWHVPDLGSHNCLVKITSVDFLVVTDTSDNPFSILALEVTKPNGGEIVEQGRFCDIAWTCKGTIPDNLVKLEYSLDNGSTWTTIADPVPNNLLYRNWQAPSGVSKESDTVLVRVSASTNPNISDKSNAVFAIVPPPAMTITAPVGGEKWSLGTTHTLSWKTNQRQFSENVVLEYSTDDFVEDVHLIAQVPIGTPAGQNANADITGNYDWNISIDTLVSDAIKIRVKEADIPAGRATQQIVFAVSNAISINEPAITLTAPTAADIWVAADTHNITWTTTGLVSDNLLLQYKVGGDPLSEVGWTVINQLDGEGNPIGEPNDGLFNWLIPAEAVGEQVYIRISDLNREQVKGVSEAFKVLGYAEIIVTYPNGGEEITIGVAYNLTWKSYGRKLESGGSDYNKINIYYSKDNGATWTPIAYQTANTKSYSWMVPDAETEQALIKIEDTNDEQITDVSDAVFKIVPPVITVDVPNGGELFYATGKHEIKWSCIGAISNNLTLQYSTNGGETWTDIATGVSNTGAYSWEPVADVNTNNALIKIIDAARTGKPVFDVSNNAFTIRPPTITVVSPNGNEQWPVGTYQSITWTTMGKDAGAIRDLVIQYSNNGGISWNPVATISKTDPEFTSQSYNWEVPNTVSTACLVKLFDSTRPATVDQSDSNFRIVLPYVKLTSPKAGDQWPIGAIREITWNSVGAVSEDLKLQYSPDNGTTWKDFTPPAAHIANTRTYSVTVPDDLAQLAKVQLVDNLEPQIFDTSATFSIVNPIIKVVSPNSGELWTVDDIEKITWENIGSVGSNLKFEYSKDNFATDGILITPTAIQNAGPNTVAWSEANPTGNYALWQIPNDVSASVRVKITDLTRAGVFDKSDGDFSILPIPLITIDSPKPGDVWRVGDKRDILWYDNGGVISNNLKLEYSTDSGATYKPIASGIANSGSYTWAVPDDLSLTCKVRITDLARPTTVAESPDTFSIKDPLITISLPNGAEKFAFGDTVPVTWATVGSVSDNLIMEFSTDGGSNYTTAKDPTGMPGINVANSGRFEWLVPNDIDITSNALFKIKDGNRAATFDVSDRTFSIISVPRFVNIQIAHTDGTPGTEFVLGDVANITWQWEGLKISNNLRLEASTDDFVNIKSLVASGVANTGKYTWTIPQDALTGSTLKLRITDANRTVITGKSEGYFRIRGGFTLTAPNGGEYWVAKSPQTITWHTRGNVPRVKLEYTTDADGIIWSTIAASLENAGSYTWILPDIKANSVKVRVSDPDDATVYDISDNTFNILYVTVKFNILDFDTLSHLSDFSVSEPVTNWVDTGLSSPIIRTDTYPYGTYTTFFTKTNYIDNSATWNPPKQISGPLETYVVIVWLENVASAQVTWEARLTYSYSPADDTLSAVGSLQRKGKLVGTRPEERERMGAATLTIYEPDGVTERISLIVPKANDSGMYIFPPYANTKFEAGKVYPATLTIMYNEMPYISAANLDVGSERLQYEFFTKTAQQLATSVLKIEAAVAGGTAEMKQALKATEAAVKVDTAKILTATETAIPAGVEEVRAKVETAMRSEILNRESTVRLNQTLAIRYRTYSGLSATTTIDVYNANNKQVIGKDNKVKMTEIGTTGIYEYPVTFSSEWGRGDFTIVCAESTRGTLDALIITVLRTDIELISSDVQSIVGATAGITGLKRVADTLNTQFSIIETVLSKVGKDLLKEVKDVVASATTLESVYSQLSGVAKQIKGLTGETGINLDKLYEVSVEKKTDMTYLINKTQELKATIDLNMKMVDNIANKPVTTAWFEYR